MPPPSHSTRPRFTLVDRRESVYQGTHLYTLHFQAATGQADLARENSSMFAFAPSGKLELPCLKPEYAEQFRLGQTYYLDLVPVSVEPASDSIPTSLA
jgi:hypothetical protein